MENVSLKLPRHLKQSENLFKILPEDLEHILELRKAGYSTRTIGKLYNVSKTCIIYWTNIEYRKKQNKVRGIYKPITKARKQRINALIEVKKAYFGEDVYKKYLKQQYVKRIIREIKEEK